MKSLNQLFLLFNTSGLSSTSVHHELILCLSHYYCIVNTHVIIAFINSSLYSYVMYTQVKEMVNLNLFIEHHYKYIVSIIRVKLILTLHLSTANWRILPTTGCCYKNAAASPLHTLCNIFLPGRVNTTVPRVVAYFNALWWNSNFTLLYRNATTYGIINYMETEQDCVIVVPNIKLELLGNITVQCESITLHYQQAGGEPSTERHPCFTCYHCVLLVAF